MTTPPQFGQYAQYAPRQEQCPLHPESYAVGYCKRCNRPACPACAVQTEVGILCRECYRENQRTARGFGGTMRFGGHGGRSTGSRILDAARAYPVITAIVAICVLVWVVSLFTGSAVSQWLGYSPIFIAEPWRFITSAFVHSGFIHLLFNMIMLIVMGSLLERTMGRVQFAFLYLFSAIGGNLFIEFWGLLFPSQALSLTVGASGALFGILGAMLVSLRRLNLPTTSLLVLIAINLLYGLIMPGVSWQAHLGGLAFGALACSIYLGAAQASRKTMGRHVTRNLVLATVGIAAIEIVLAVVLGLLTASRWGIL